MKAKKTVFVGMSGGVDSSVAAALLKQAKPNNFSKLFGRPTPKGFRGYLVIGIFIKIEIGGDCSWRQERRSAFTAAAMLDIPLYTIDLSKEYEQLVVDYMLGEYRAGRTPNPDVMCNQQIKFGAFYDWAIKTRIDADKTQINADFIATGHYARVERTRELSMINSQFTNSKIKDIENSLEIENCKLKIPKDLIKDQTYFLYAIDREKLAKILFPLGDLKKDEVRKLAKKFGLANADKPDSQGLCFVGDFDFKRFLREKIGVKKGEVRNEQGEVVGEHDGVYLFTIGERHGFTIYQHSNDEKPYYIVTKDLANNVLTVSTTPLSGSSEEVGEIALEKVNWLVTAKPTTAKIYNARLRHRGALTACQLREGENGQWRVIFTEPVTSPAPGQSVVIYDGDVCFGGGVIK